MDIELEDNKQFISNIPRKLWILLTSTKMFHGEIRKLTFWIPTYLEVWVIKKKKKVFVELYRVYDYMDYIKSKISLLVP